MLGRWVEERKRDHFYKLAKREGYRSRAAYKLLQANKSFRFLRPGNKVIDLGCAPGGWLQVASELVGREGRVLGVDIKPTPPIGAANVMTTVGDVRDESLTARLLGEMDGRVDVVLSDASPNISGVWEVDYEKQLELVRASMLLALRLLKPRGVFFAKIFDGPRLHELLSELKGVFVDVRIVKPPASRPKSAELYVLARKPIAR